MFMLRNVGKLIFGSGGNQEALVELTQGQLYLVRPLSPKGYSELIFKDAAARIRRTAQDFHYQLVVQRVYEEGEAELLAEEEGEDAEIDALAVERDEKTFLLDEALRLRFEIREGTEKVIAWRDLSGDTGDVYEFVCDSSVTSSLVSHFERVTRQCQYERKYRKPHATATEDELAQFEPEDEPIPPASPLHGPSLAESILSTSGHIELPATSVAEPVPSIESALEAHSRVPLPISRIDNGDDDADEDLQYEDAMPRPNTSAKRSASPLAKKANASSVPTAASAPEALEEYARLRAELHFYDSNAGAFISKDDEVVVTVTEVGTWQYWLQVEGRDRVWLALPIVADINPVFNFEYLSFIFNHFSHDGNIYSWLFRFKDTTTMETFQEALLRCLWEQLNESKWAKVKQKDQAYITEAFADLAMEDVPDEDESEEEGSAEQDEEEEEEFQEDDEDAPEQATDGKTNSQLAVGYKNDRTFVIRGEKIGVFSHGDNNSLRFSTTINNIKTPGGKAINPRKVMLHNEDRDMVLQHDTDPHRLYRMDLEHGKVVDEWNVHEDIPVVSFAPEEKFAQLTARQPFLGISHNALFRIDPREADNKLDGEKLKMYTTKNDFSAAATTEKGYIAVASNKGDVRMFDRLGINAKTHIPGLGEPIIGLDLSADGRWILATCRTYLLLVDALQKDGKNEGKLGFEKSFTADSKPQPRRLALSPEHVAQIAHETKKGVTFTPAKFNTGGDSGETSIITATGPYIIEWILKKIIRGNKNPYLIKRYAEEVKADDFKFGSDRDIIVALPNEINMIGRQSLKKPTRQSLAGEFRNANVGTPGRSPGRIGTAHSGRYKLGKDSVVNSPY